jgi:hypothetical protein
MAVGDGTPLRRHNSHLQEPWQPSTNNDGDTNCSAAVLGWWMQPLAAGGVGLAAEGAMLDGD